MIKRLALLGSTGSIGHTTLQVAAHLGIEVVALAARGRDLETFCRQIQEVRPRVVAVYEAEKAAEVRARFPGLEVLEGEEGICACACWPECDGVMMAIVGLAALAPTLAAIEAGKTLALANKEVLVSAGALVMQKVRDCAVTMIPVDSEHSALFQCLLGKNLQEVSRLIITSSGGPFLHTREEDLAYITVEQALKHPTWSMGAKITVDSSTLMNKALEIIEAYYLFGLHPDKIDVMIHPQSLIHCLVEWQDGNFFAHMHPPKMHYPVQYALTYPQRLPSSLPPLDFRRYQQIEFLFPDHQKFPVLGLAKEALRCGKSVSCYLNAANEVLVDRFLKKDISWQQIMWKLDKLLAQHQPVELKEIETVVAMDHQARREAQTA